MCFWIVLAAATAVAATADDDDDNDVTIIKWAIQSIFSFHRDLHNKLKSRLKYFQDM